MYIALFDYGIYIWFMIMQSWPLLFDIVSLDPAYQKGVQAMDGK